jgi:hypothetical protein
LKKCGKYIACAFCFVLLSTRLFALYSNDSIKQVKPPKHYFKQVLYVDYYLTGKRNLDTVNMISKQLKSYQVSQFSIGYNIPVITKDYYSKDSTRISNFHFLITTNYSRLNLNFEGISKHTLTKFSVGGRAIYNNGKKSIFFAEFSPFSTTDLGYSYTKTLRLSSTFLYNYTANAYFSFRVGYTRLFFLGNRYSLPYIGIRVGKLDGVNFSVQFPRAITFNVPIGSYVRASWFTRPQGGLYTFANTDSLKIGSILNNNKLYFGRYEFLSGLRLDIQPSQFFSMYFSGGTTTNNKILFHYAAPKSANSPYRESFTEKVKSAVFLNFGLVFRFGKSKSVYYNNQMYEAFDINNTVTPADNGPYNGNGDIPAPAKKLKKVSTDEVLDLIEEQDMY